MNKDWKNLKEKILILPKEQQIIVCKKLHFNNIESLIEYINQIIESESKLGLVQIEMDK